MRAVVTGRMRRHGDIISIQADLIDLENVAQLWGQHYDHKVSDVLLVQDDISRDIFENLRLKLNVEEKKQLEAYRLYLKGRNAWNKRTGDALQQAIEFFNQAIAIDPNYGAAYAGLLTVTTCSSFTGGSTERRISESEGSSHQALEIDENSAEPTARWRSSSFAGTGIALRPSASFRTRSSSNPAYAPAHQWYSSYLVAVERFDEAIAEAKRTEELEPLSFVASSHLGWIYYLSGRQRQSDRAVSKDSRARSEFISGAPLSRTCL